MDAGREIGFLRVLNTATDGRTNQMPDKLWIGQIWSWTGDIETGPATLPTQPAPYDGFVVSDGTERFTLTPVQSGREVWLKCLDGVPKRNRDYRIIRICAPAARMQAPLDNSNAVICFAKGTLIRTESGEKPVELLSLGDRVLTRDDGPQEILWIGNRHMSGARLYAMPQLRPVRLRSGAMSRDMPLGDLLVSPQHRILIEGARAQELFGQSEVLAAACDLVDDDQIYVDHTVASIDYIHLLLPGHQILWANNMPSESYHPANTSLEMVAPEQRSALLNLFPEIANDPLSYGGFARRNLDSAEAGLLKAA